jgi:exopolysaccharide biosynthesis WecB/TagA/CpsF family protein
VRILLPTIRDPGQIGGTSTHLDMLSRGLGQLGHEARVLYLGEIVPRALRDPGIVWPAGALNRVRRGWGMVYAAEARGRLLARVTARELAGRERDAAGTADATAAQPAAATEAAPGPWQVLNAQEVYSVPALRAVADEHGLPLVLTLHGYPVFESLSEGYTAESAAGRRYLMRAEIRALRLADAIVTVDTRLLEHVLKLVPERSGDALALMNFIDTSAFFPSTDGREELREKWAVPLDRTVLFCPRRLVKKNGVVYPALALAAMDPLQCARFLLLHAGEGGERQAIEQVVREQGLEGQVRLLGGQGREEILELYRLADIVLVPSVHSENVEEATSLAALEAMASGRPLIAGAVGGLAEIVDDGANGLLFPGGDAGALAAAILRLSDDPQLGSRLAARARQYVVENHSHLQAAAAYAQVYGQAWLRAQARADLAAEEGWGSFDVPPPGAGARVAQQTLQAVDATTSEGSGPFESVSVLGLAVHLVSLDQAAAWVVEWARAGTAARDSSLAPAPSAVPTAVAGPAPTAAAAEEPVRTHLAVSFNPELVMRAHHDPLAAEALLGADLRYPDGVGVVWALSRQGVTTQERVPGIELAERVLEAAAEAGLGVYFLGGAEGVAGEAAEKMIARFSGLQVCGTHHGYFARGSQDERDAVDAVRGSGAAILLAAMGAPRQEVFMFDYRLELGVGAALGVGGSFDVWAGRVSRAPEWTRRLRAEWLYRLAADPRRVRRQLALPRFALGVLAGPADSYGPGRAARPPDQVPESPEEPS